MTFLKVNGSSVELNKPIMMFLYISIAVAFGILLFTMFMYAILQIFTSSGFSELNSAIDGDDGRERIDDDDDLEDV